MWKTIASKMVFEHKRITLLEDEVELPNGHRTDYLYIKDRGDAASVIAIREDGKILMQKEFNYPSGQTLLQFPGGAVPYGEDIVEGAQRELMEEGGVRGGTIELIGKYLPNNRKSKSYMYVFVAKDLQEERRERDAEEFLEDFWFAPDEIDGRIARGGIENGTVLACWGVFRLRYLV